MLFNDHCLSILIALLPVPLDVQFGWPCAWTPGESGYLYFYSIGAYLMATRAFGKHGVFGKGINKTLTLWASVL